MSTFALIGIVAPKGHHMESNYIDRAEFISTERVSIEDAVKAYLENEGGWMTDLEKTMVGVIAQGTLEELRKIR